VRLSRLRRWVVPPRVKGVAGSFTGDGWVVGSLEAGSAGDCRTGRVLGGDAQIQAAHSQGGVGVFADEPYGACGEAFAAVMRSDGVGEFGAVSVVGGAEQQDLAVAGCLLW
jgi:hypothetical protein